MMSDVILFLFIIALIGTMVYDLATSKVTEEERQEMLNSDEMFP